MPVRMNGTCDQNIVEALGCIPNGQYVLTARHEDRRAGVLVSWVQQTSAKPPMVMVAVNRGCPILAMISDTSQFGLCQLQDDERIITYKFARASHLHEDPYLGFEMITQTATGVPILANVLGYLECDLVCHMDIEGDHDLFVGRVLNGQFLGGVPRVKLPLNQVAVST